MRILNYTLTELLHESARTLIYRAQCDHISAPVIIKTFNQQYPSKSDLSALTHSFNIMRKINHPSIPKAYSLESHQKNLYLIMEDIGGESFKRVFLSENPLISEKEQKPEPTSSLKTKKSLDAFIEYAIQIVEGLSILHDNHIIHKDINPSNIIVNRSSNRVQIIDFDIASFLAPAQPPSQLEGSLSYISPEQTGRMNRNLDYRSDFYSMGITFYELLTGQFPFEGKDIMSWIHSHIAKEPTPIRNHDKSIPEPIAEIIHKLIEKMAENRYQSTAGIKSDLTRCLQEWKQKGKIDTFRLALVDYSETLQISQKLYGRKKEVETVFECFDLVILQSSPILLTVAGRSGIGKSALVNEVHRPIVSRKGYFVTGKFEKFQAHIPYSALILAFESFLSQLLKIQPEELKSWKQKLLYALEGQGQVVVDLFPTLELIIGSQEALPSLETAPALRRFKRIFQKFVACLTNDDTPLVLFLDDLQWADMASIDMLSTLLNINNCKLLIIGSYRDNEVDSCHYLALALDEIQKKWEEKDGTIPLKKISVEPLNTKDINTLLRESLNEENTEKLAELVLQKTAGNPFFIYQFLDLLTQKRADQGLHTLLQFDRKKCKWVWDTEEISNQHITENVVELMLEKLSSLPEITGQVLEQAACIGNSFNIQMLGVITNKPLLDIIDSLWPALEQGFVLPVGNQSNWRSQEYLAALKPTKETKLWHQSVDQLRLHFLHDRVHQAVYESISDKKKSHNHLTIGRLLIKQLTTEELDNLIFEVVEHLNKGRHLMSSQDEYLSLAKLDLKAGLKAKEASAYDSATHLLGIARAMLPDDHWSDHYQLSYTIYSNAAICEYGCTRLEEAEQLFDTLLSHTENEFERAKIYSLQLFQHIGQGQFEKAAEKARQALAIANIALPIKKEQFMPAIAEEYALLNKNLEGIDVSQLYNAPEVADHLHKLMLKITTHLIVGAFVSGHKELPVFCLLKSMNLTFLHGKSQYSAMIYACYGVSLARQSQYRAAVEYSKLSLKLVNDYPDSPENAIALHVNGAFMMCYQKPVQESINLLERSYQLALRNQDIFESVLSFSDIVYFLYIKGNPLNQVHQYALKAMKMAQNNKMLLSLMVGVLFKRLTESLQEEKVTDKTLRLSQESLDQASFDSDQWKILSRGTLHGVYMHIRIQAAFWSCCLDHHTDLKGVLNIIEEAEPTLYLIPGHIFWVEHYFIKATILYSIYPRSSKSEQAILRKKIDACHTKLLPLEGLCPENFEHKNLILAAESALLSGDDWEALNNYDKAIQHAQINGYDQYAGLINERCAQFWLQRGKLKYASVSIKEACFFYEKWGANLKTNKLKEHHLSFAHFSEGVGRLASDRASDETISVHDSGTVRNNHLLQSGALDLASIMKASQAISSELRLDKLFIKVIEIILENSGAQAGVLLLENKGEMEITAIVKAEESERLLHSVDGKPTEEVPRSVIQYVQRTGEDLLLQNSFDDDHWNHDIYIKNHRPHSILCMPIHYQERLTGILYLENNLISKAFSKDRLSVLKTLLVQVAISLENGRLFHEISKLNAGLEHEIEQRSTELKTTQEQLLQVEKMAALGELVAGVAHELNTPLGVATTASTHVDVLLEELKASYSTEKMTRTELESFMENAKEGLSVVTTSLRRSAELVNSFKLVAVNQSSQDQSLLNLFDHLDSVITAIKPLLITGEHDFAWRCSRKLLIYTYPNAFSQIITQLTTNSLIHGFEELKKGKIELEIQESADRLRLKYSDNGRGMPKEVLDKIFNPFMTTKRGSECMGLGTHIIFNLVHQQLKGTISCESQVGIGTTFIIDMPLKRSEINNA